MCIIYHTIYYICVYIYIVTCMNIYGKLLSHKKLNIAICNSMDVLSEIGQRRRNTIGFHL